ncbi:MAG: flagellar biosynthesis protein FlhA [Clostridia bacterium]|jgi:flagellar biosynthesis protein FlhA
MKFGDIAIALIVILVILLIIIPLSPPLLDTLLVFNITLSLVILLLTLYIKEPLQFSVFPSMLLLTTLLRLGLNISSTRLILGNNGEAGEVIKTFGHFVIQGNAVVGFIIFLIILVMQFIVITKGAERVAEVAARFTLDAMPGKQMAIDADLNSGLIDETTARARRLDIQREADFYGAMDGASKFVKGDAIVGIIITVINCVGGIIIGMVQGNMTFDKVLEVYILATVGDGLVSQLPALLISTATGVIVTRAASENNMSRDVTKQLFSQPVVLTISGGVLVAMSLIPELPRLPMWALAGLMLYLGYVLNRSQIRQQDMAVEERQETEAEQFRKPESVISLLEVDPVEMEFGYSLIPLVDASQGGDFLDRVVMIRRQCALELGMIIPVVRLRDNIQINPNEYIIKIKGEEVARGEVLMDHLLAMDPGTAEGELEGIDTTEPAFGLPAKWIRKELRETAELAGYTIVDPPSVIATHLTEVFKVYGHELLGRQEVQTLIDHVAKSHPSLVEEVVPKILSVGEVQKVLANLLKEGVPIRDMVTILETLGDYGGLTKDPDMLTEYVRQSLKRTITRRFVGENQVRVVTLDPELEQMIMDNVRQSEHGSYLSLDPEKIQDILRNLMAELKKLTGLGLQPIVLSSPVVRIYFKKLTEQLVPDLTVLSYNELEHSVQIQSVGMVSI